MASLDILVAAWDEGYREFGIALEGMPDGELWKRAHPRLLSVGELAGHVVYGQASHVFGKDSDVRSPLIDDAFQYYPSNLANPITPTLGTAEVLAEALRIHALAKVVLAAKSMEDPHPNWGNWGNLVQYQVFHIAYHTGQIYSVRHLLGHETEDN